MKNNRIVFCSIISWILFWCVSCQKKEKISAAQLEAQIEEHAALRDNNLDSALLLFEHDLQLALDNNFLSEAAAAYRLISQIYVSKSNLALADSFLQVCLTIAEPINDRANISAAYIEQANMLQNKTDLKGAEALLRKALAIKKEIGDKDGESVIYNNLGIIKELKGNYQEAVAFYHKTIPLCQELDNKRMLSNVYNNLSIIQYLIGEYAEAINYQKQALKASQEAKNRIGESMIRVGLANYYLAVDSLKTASRQANLAMKICEELPYPKGKLFVLSVLGDIALQQKDYEKSLEYYNQFVEQFSPADDPYMISEIKLKMEQVYSELGWENRGPEQLTSTLATYQAMGAKFELMTTYEVLASMHAKQNQHQKAYEYLLKSKLYRDSFLNEEKTKNILALEEEFEVKEKEAKNRMLEKEKLLQEAKISRQHAFLVISVLLALLLAFLSYWYFKRNQIKEKTNQLLLSKNKEIQSKNEQIQTLHEELTHRVKNNLSFISSLMRLQIRRLENPEAKVALREAENRIQAMAMIHRRLFEKEDTVEIELADYLTELVNFLRKSYAQPGKQTVIALEMDEVVLKAEPAIRIGLIVNELVTNAFKYAFAEQIKPKITVHLNRSSKGWINLEVWDNGSGIPQELDFTTTGTLGLPLVQTIVKELKGTMDWRQNAGTQFSLQFPTNRITA